MYNSYEMSVTRRRSTAPPWLLLAFSLPAKGASLRVAVWRKLQRNGSLALGNSGYLLPNTRENREHFEWLARAIRDGHGEASVVQVQAIDNWSDSQLTRRFSEARRRDYRELLNEIRRLRAAAPGSNRSKTDLSRLRRRFQEIASIDFFGGCGREEVERALRLAEQPATVHDAEALKVRKTDYRGRTWVTRPRPGVDRVMSAWLIRKFIDPKARFAFAIDGKAPVGAVPFDMYQGGFGHRGDDCTFETLMKVFRIRDHRVLAMAETVHDADLFDDKFGRREGFGIDEVMKGWARQGLSDTQLLERGVQLAEGLYQSLR
jgi:hypothetical protein